MMYYKLESQSILRYEQQGSFNYYDNFMSRHKRSIMYRINYSFHRKWFVLLIHFPYFMAFVTMIWGFIKSYLFFQAGEYNLGWYLFLGGILGAVLTFIVWKILISFLSWSLLIWNISMKHWKKGTTKVCINSRHAEEPGRETEFGFESPAGTQIEAIFFETCGKQKMTAESTGLRGVVIFKGEKKRRDNPFSDADKSIERFQTTAIG